MNSIKLVRFIFAALLALAGLTSQTSAANLTYGITVTTNASAPTSITYVIALTNASGTTLSNVAVTNQFSSAITVASTSNFRNGTPTPPSTGSDITTPDETNRRIIFRVDSFPANQWTQLSATVNNADPSTLTNTITFVAGSEVTSREVIGTDATGSGGGGGGGSGTAGDLSVFFVLPPNSNPIQGDFFDLGIVATNRGPGAVTGIILTNIFDGLVIRGVTPTQAITTNSAGAVPINVGTLQPNTAIQFTFNLTTTNSDTFNLTSTIGSANNADPDASNNTANYDLAVAETNSPNVTVSIGAAQESRPNLQTGLFTEIVNVRNDSGAPIPAFRLNVFGMNATNILYNAQGTNNGIPYVVYPVPVPNGDTARVVLEYFNSRRLPVPTTSTNYFVTELRSFNPTNSVTTTTNIFTWVTRDTAGDPIVNFPAAVGNRYTIVYSDNAAFTNNVFRAYPSFIAPGNIVQWRDTGPPKTLPHTPTRFYRVLEGQ